MIAVAQDSLALPGAELPAPAGAPGTWSPLHIATDPIRLIDPTACTSCAFCARVCPDCVLTVYAAPKSPRGTAR